MKEGSQPIKMSNKRVDQRVITLLPIGVTLINKHEEIGVFRVINISSNGISLIIANKIPIDTELSVRIKFPAGSIRNVKGNAVVRRCEEIPSHADHLKQYLCGLSLKVLSEHRQEIDGFIEQAIREGSGIIDRRLPGRLNNGIVFYNPEKFHTYKLSRQTNSVEIFQLTLKDLDELEEVEVKAWGKGMCASRAMLKSRLENFPEGMIGARKNGKLMGYVGLMIVDSSICDKDFTWMGITDGGYIRATHNPNGDCLYGVSLSVIPSEEKNVAVKLLKAAGKLSIRKALKGILLGCRIPNYHKYAKKMTVEEYIHSTTKTGRIIDPELAMYRQLNAVPVRPVANYFEDPDSLNYGLLVFWNNPFYDIQRNEFPFFFKNVTVDFT